MTANIDPTALAGRAVLVTGGAGFIGRHLVRRLAAAGASVEIWIRPGSRADMGASAAVREVDVRDRAMVESALRARRPSVVFHLAGLRLIERTISNLGLMIETHVTGTLNLLGGLAPDARVVVVGSGEEYGRAPVPFTEDHVPEPQTAYAVSRLATTLACLAVAAPRISVARLAVVYGPAQTGTMFIPSLVRACAIGEAFRMSSGEQTRDFVFVDDAVDAMIRLAGCESAVGEVVNIGSGSEIRVRAVAERVARLAGGADLQIGAIASRPGEAERYVCSIAKIRRLCNWEPSIGLTEGLALTLDWWRRQRAEAGIR